jgi:putative flippase GtrA
MMKRELTKYIIVGISAVATDFVTYRLLGLVMALSIAKTISYILGMIVAFILNRSWTFKSERKVNKDVIRFIVVYTLSLFLNVSVNHGLLYLFPYAITIAFTIATGVSVITNYVGQKFWVFKK